MIKEKKIPLKAVLIYSFLFYTCWGLFEWYGRSKIENIVLNEWLSQIVNSGFIKTFVWTLPAWFLICRYQSSVYVVANEIFHTKVNWQKYLPVYAALAAYLIIRSLVLKGSLAISPEFKLTQLITVLFVGITEEMVFRGWLLNVIIRENNKWAAVLINAIMFLFIHFPRWLYEGIFITSFTSMGFLSIIILSIIFSWTFIKSRNLLVPITLHMFWDLLTFLLS